jgi:hypothetical protein
MPRCQMVPQMAIFERSDTPDNNVDLRIRYVKAGESS